MTLTREQFTTFLEKLDFFLTLLGEIGCRGPQGQGMLEYIGGALKRDSEESLSARLQSIAGSLDSIAHGLNDENRIRRVALSATENFKYFTQVASSAGFVLNESYADETVREFTSDWLEITGDETHRVPRALVNVLYGDWCAREQISPEDRVTTSVLSRSLKLLGTELVSGQPDHKGTRMHSFVGVRVWDGVQGL